MSDNSSFLTIDKPAGPVEYKEKNSKFISLLFPVSSTVEADTILKALKKQYFDSTHICFAYRIGQGFDKYFRYSDDGEPSGTAGIPILNEIKGASLFNILIAVVRYFGGTKLGTGGLMRAYSKASKEVLKTSHFLTVRKKRNVKFVISYKLMGEVMKMIDLYSVTIINREFKDNSLEVIMDIPEHLFNNAREYLMSISNGKLVI